MRSGPLAGVARAWNTRHGSLFGLHVLLAQVTWTAVLLALGVGLIRSRFRPEVLLMTLTIAGIAVFTLLFQARSRYLLVEVPVVVALAAILVPADAHLVRTPFRRSRPSEGSARPDVPTSAHPDTVPVGRIGQGATLRASQASGGTRGRHHPWRGRRVGSDLRRWREARLR
jgi:hypothetical protein